MNSTAVCKERKTVEAKGEKGEKRRELDEWSNRKNKKLPSEF